MTVYLFRASGPTTNDLLGHLLAPIELGPCELLDMQTACNHGETAVSLVLLCPDEDAGPIAALKAHAQSLGLCATAAVMPEQDLADGLSAERLPTSVATVVGDSLGAGALRALAECVAGFGLQVEAVERLTFGRTDQGRRCFDLHLRGPITDQKALRTAVYSLTQQLRCDVVVQPNDPGRSDRRLAAFDMDSTLIQTEVINELAREHGVESRVAEITERAMNGELDFNQSLRERLGLMRGLSENVLEQVAQRLPISPGVERLVTTLRHLGIKTVILSGGFDYFARYLQRRLGIDEVHANQLEIVQGKLTGQVVGPIVNGPRKAELLTQLAAKASLSREQIIAVGDGANDLQMLAVAGLGVAYHAKPVVRAAADFRICHTDIDSILYFLGLSDRSIEQVLARSAL